MFVLLNDLVEDDSFILKIGSLSATKAKKTTTEIAYSRSSDEQNRLFVKGEQITNSLKYLLHVDNLKDFYHHYCFALNDCFSS